MYVYTVKWPLQYLEELCAPWVRSGAVKSAKYSQDSSRRWHVDKVERYYKRPHDNYRLQEHRRIIS